MRPYVEWMEAAQSKLWLLEQLIKQNSTELDSWRAVWELAETDLIDLAMSLHPAPDSTQGSTGRLHILPWSLQLLKSTPEEDSGPGLTPLHGFNCPASSVPAYLATVRKITNWATNNPHHELQTENTPARFYRTFSEARDLDKSLSELRRVFERPQRGRHRRSKFDYSPDNVRPIVSNKGEVNEMPRLATRALVIGYFNILTYSNQFESGLVQREHIPLLDIVPMVFLPELSTTTQVITYSEGAVISPIEPDFPLATFSPTPNRYR
jgi:hypothetical protein